MVQKIRNLTLTQTRLIVLAAVFLVITGNFTFFNKLTDVYPWGLQNAGFLISAAILLCCLMVLLKLLASLVLPTRVLVSVVILVTAATSYFSDQYGTVIDTTMIRNTMETNLSESTDLFSLGLLIRFFLFGILPVILIWQIPYVKANKLKELRYTLYTSLVSIVMIVLCLFSFSDQYASFFASISQSVITAILFFRSTQWVNILLKLATLPHHPSSLKSRSRQAYLPLMRNTN